MKKILSMLLIVSLALIMGACKQPTPDEIFQDSIEFEDENGVDVDEESALTDDDLELLTWEPTEENNETFFLIRDGVSYSLGAIDPEKAAEYLPVTLTGTNSHGGCLTYSGIVIGASDSINNGFFSFGNVPVPVYQEGDRIIVSSSEAVPRLQLRKVNYYGDAIRLLISSNAYSVYDDATADETYGLRANNTEVKDSAGNVVSDIYNLNAGEIYIVSWSEGTKIHEITLPADSKFYVPERDRMDDPEYEIEGSLTEDDYAEYDLSGVAPGTYKLVNTNDMVSQGLITVE